MTAGPIEARWPHCAYASSLPPFPPTQILTLSADEKAAGLDWRAGRGRIVTPTFGTPSLQGPLLLTPLPCRDPFGASPGFCDPLHTFLLCLWGRLKSCCHLDNWKTCIHKNICTPMFIAALFTVAKTWRQPKCPLLEKWIKKMWYKYTMAYSSAIRKYEITPFVTTWMDLRMSCYVK